MTDKISIPLTSVVSRARQIGKSLAVSKLAERLGGNHVTISPRPAFVDQPIGAAGLLHAGYLQAVTRHVFRAVHSSGLANAMMDLVDSDAPAMSGAVSSWPQMGSVADEVARVQKFFDSIPAVPKELNPLPVTLGEYQALKIYATPVAFDPAQKFPTSFMGVELMIVDGDDERLIKRDAAMLALRGSSAPTPTSCDQVVSGVSKPQTDTCKLGNTSTPSRES